MYEDDTTVRDLKNELLSESNSEIQRKQINFEVGNVHSGIKDERVTEKEEEGNLQLKDDGVESILKKQWRR